MKGDSKTAAAATADWLHSLFKANPLPMVIYDRVSYKILQLNDKAKQYYGYSESELENMSVMNLYLQEDISAAAKEANLERDGNFHHTGIRCQQKKDGTLLEVEVFQELIDFENREAVLAIFHDITALCRDAQKFNLIQRMARIGYWIMDLESGDLEWSDQEYRNFGLHPHSIVPTREAFLNLVHPDDREMVQEKLSRSISGENLHHYDYRIICPDGSTRILREQGTLVLGKGNQRRLIFATSVDVTEQKRIEDQLVQIKADLNRAQDIARSGTWICEIPSGQCFTTSVETRKLLGLEPKDTQISMDTFFQCVHPDDRERIRQARLNAYADPGGHYDVEYRVVQPDGTQLDIHSIAEVSFDLDGKPNKIIGIIQDVTEKKRTEEYIRRLAFYDRVTGLPNRVLLRQKLEAILADSHTPARPIAMLIINLSRVRDLNYTLGHQNGDILLKEVGARIRQALNPKDIAAKIGNAQFAIVLPDITAGDATTSIKKILRALEDPFSIAGITYGFGAQIGIALFPGHGRDADTLLRKADVALYQARLLGQIYAFYNPAQDPYNPQRLALMGEFKQAISTGELELYCQPKADMKSGEIIGAEALVRWQHPKFGLIPPDRFLSLIEPTEMIHLLTDFMLHAAAKQCYEWQQQGFHIPLAVNLSARNLSDPELKSNLKFLLLTWGGDASSLGLEITESSLMADPIGGIAALNELSEMGFRLFLDDFGTGYSSLSYLTKLPINVIKIDHGFTMHMLDDKGAAAIVKSTIDMAHNLGMSVVAEGTASQQIWDALSKLGCDEAQGHYISPPLPAKEFIPLLQNSNFHIPSYQDRQLL